MTDIRLRILGESLIQVGNRCIDTRSQRLFALLLYLCQGGNRDIDRGELIELLFPRVRQSSRAKQSLRQLLHRLRIMRAPIATKGTRLWVAADCVTSAVDDVLAMTGRERLRVSTSQLAVLPGYAPTISSQWSDWVETLRDQTAAKLLAAVRDDFRTARQHCEWSAVLQVGQTLCELNANSEEVVSGVAQALLLQGRKHDALDAVDAYLKDCDPTSTLALRQLRTRIARTAANVAALSSSFRGRRDAMRALSEQWRLVSSGGPQLAVVTGSPGIGKTRLATEFGSYVQLDGGRHLNYRCDRSDAATPYALFRSLLPQLRNMRGSLGASPDLQCHLDRVATDANISGALEPAAGEAMKASIQLALVDLLEAVSAEKPLLIAIDDASLQDSASRHAIRALFEHRRVTAVMILLCERSFDGVDLGPSDFLHTQVHHLSPLSEDDSVAVLQDLIPPHRAPLQTLRAWAKRARGNPYYLHAIAYAGLAAEEDTPAPFDIRRFAASVYHGLESDTRVVFETCLLLGSLASVARVQAIVGINTKTLIEALRNLENGGLLHSAGRELRCSHALLEEAALQLIPTSVRALLHRSIAMHLQEECGVNSYPTALTWASAEHWIAIGDTAAAARLLMHCAAQAAAIGEPQTATETLLQVPIDMLPTAERVPVLRQLIEYAEAAGDFDRSSETLRSLLRVERELGLAPELTRETEFHVIEAELRCGANPTPALTTLQALVRAPDVKTGLRLRACVSLLIAADMALDQDLAMSTYNLVTPEMDQDPPEAEVSRRAELIYHTVFGSQFRALQEAEGLLARYSNPDLTQVAVKHRRNIAFAFIRLGCLDRAKPVLLDDFEFMTTRNITSESLFRIVLLAESFFHEGDLDETRRWVEKGARIVARNQAITMANRAAYLSIAAESALAEGRLDDAESFLDQANLTYPAISSPRYDAINISLRYRIQHANDGSPASDRALQALRRYYRRGKELGAQDSIVEALWLAEIAAGRAASASTILADYLTVSRRECNAAAWTLRFTTACDTIWKIIDSPALRDVETGYGT